MTFVGIGWLGRAGLLQTGSYREDDGPCLAAQKSNGVGEPSDGCRASGSFDKATGSFNLRVPSIPAAKSMPVERLDGCLARSAQALGRAVVALHIGHIRQQQEGVSLQANGEKGGG